MTAARPPWPASSDPPPRFVDAHLHFWQRGEPGLSWPMLEPGFAYPLHRFDQNGRYTSADHRAETAPVPVTKIVHAQAAQADDPVVETAWLQRMADADPAGWPNGIVGSGSLSSPSTRAMLEGHAAHPNFRGVRDVTFAEHLGDPALDRGLVALADLGAVCDAMVRLPRFADLAAVADRHPDVVFVLGHGGTPIERTPEFLRAWRAGLGDLARRPNIVCKVSGFGIGDNEWTVDSLAPVVLGCIDAFGVNRCLFTSNWPVDKLFSTYTELLGAFDVITAHFSHDERDALFAATSERVYRI